jgi:hypothetical protein
MAKRLITIQQEFLKNEAAVASLKEQQRVLKKQQREFLKNEVAVASLKEQQRVLKEQQRVLKDKMTEELLKDKSAVLVLKDSSPAKDQLVVLLDQLIALESQLAKQQATIQLLEEEGKDRKNKRSSPVPTRDLGTRQSSRPLRLRGGSASKQAVRAKLPQDRPSPA